MSRRFAQRLVVLGLAVAAIVGVTTPVNAIVDTGTVLPAPVPGGQTNQLRSVSCPTTTWCMGVGDSEPGGAAPRMLAMVSDGTAFTRVAIPSISGSQEDLLYSVSCTSTTHCVAVGRYDNLSAYQPLAFAWDGTSWSRMTVPTYGSGLYEDLRSVTCTSATTCVAVGRHDDGVTTRPSVLTLNGSTWTVVTVTTGIAGSQELHGVACPSATECIAVGNYSNGVASQTLVLRGSGGTWALVSSPNSGTNQDNRLSGISCSSESSCIAVGEHFDSVLEPFSMQWNGTTWAILSMPSLPSNSVSLRGISCLSDDYCVAVGYFTPPGLAASLVLAWNGSSWSQVTSPNVPSASENLLFGVSCSTSNSCMAVGRSYVFQVAVDVLAIALSGPVPPSPTTTTVASSDPVVPAFTG